MKAHYCIFKGAKWPQIATVALDVLLNSYIAKFMTFSLSIPYSEFKSKCTWSIKNGDKAALIHVYLVHYKKYRVMSDP